MVNHRQEGNGPPAGISLLVKLDQQDQLEMAQVELGTMLRETVDAATTVDPSTDWC